MSAAVAAPSPAAIAAERIEIEFLYLDHDACTRCRRTEANLDEAVTAVAGVLDAAGTAATVRKTLVALAAQAAGLGLVSSPTIRVNGTDIALDPLESSGDAGDETCTCGGTIDCRVWDWQGEEHTAAPVPMIVDAILREIYGGRSRSAFVPDLIAGASDTPASRVAEQEAAPVAAAASCCAPSEQATCCEPAAKASCCGNASSGSCGCR